MRHRIEPGEAERFQAELERKRRAVLGAIEREQAAREKAVGEPSASGAADMGGC
jgi:hypothetical protein